MLGDRGGGSFRSGDARRRLIRLGSCNPGHDRAPSPRSLCPPAPLSQPGSARAEFSGPASALPPAPPLFCFFLIFSCVLATLSEQQTLLVWSGPPPPPPLPHGVLGVTEPLPPWARSAARPTRPTAAHRPRRRSTVRPTHRQRPPQTRPRWPPRRRRRLRRLRMFLWCLSCRRLPAVRFFLLLLQGGAWGGGGIGGEWGVSVFPAWARQEWSGFRRAWATLAGCGGRFHAPFCLGLVALRGMLRRVLPRMAVPSWVSVSCAALVWCGLSSPEATQLARCDPAGTSAPCAELCGGSPRGHGS